MVTEQNLLPTYEENSSTYKHYKDHENTLKTLHNII